MFTYLILYLAIIVLIHTVIKAYCDFKLALLKKKGANPKELYKYDLKAKRQAVIDDYKELFPFLKKIRLFKRKDI